MAIFIFIIEIASVVAGQLWLKRAMEESNRLGFRDRRVLTLFLSGVASLTISFFLTIALLQHFDLSFFYPIQGSTVLKRISRCQDLMTDPIYYPCGSRVFWLRQHGPQLGLYAAVIAER